MKRSLLILIALLALLLLREAGLINIFSASSRLEQTLTPAVSLGGLNVISVAYEIDSGEPFTPIIKEADDTYRCTIRYKLATSLSFWRWLPFVKIGRNKAQLTYMVWIGGTPVGCGSVTSDAPLSVFGIASAHNYEQMLIQPLIMQMKRDVTPKLHVFSRNL
jgi:hypothetical protein